MRYKLSYHAWRPDKTNVKIRGNRAYLKCAVDRDGNTIEFSLMPHLE
ncbi:DDE-type integrase/transposase/recombinase [Glaciimonas immobilis]|nr:DDE-type integrase/transposase/recombinase [Glaciimonas immobilis]